MPDRPVLAIFVGGQSRRMGTHKGLLPAPGSDEPIIEKLVRCAKEADLRPALVGDAAPYASLAPGVSRIADDPPGAGPLGGLHAVLRHAVATGRSHVVAVACDMPHVTSEVLVTLSNHPSRATVVAPRRAEEAPWEPMLARYDAGALVDVLDAAISHGERSFQMLFASLHVEPVPMRPAIERALVDWDTPEDLP
jgi:molybdopterin-guanine dinucleotide biosynthesis protein A